MSVFGSRFSRRWRAGMRFSGVVRILSLVVLAGGLAGAHGVSSAKAATWHAFEDTFKIDDDHTITVGNYGSATLNSWFSDDYECGGQTNPCAVDNILSEVEELVGSETIEWLKLDQLSGGTSSEYTYDGLARSVFAIKGGNSTMTVLFFDQAVTGWTIEGLPHAVSNINAVNPVPLPPAALLFLTGLAGIALVTRRRRANLGRAAA